MSQPQSRINKYGLSWAANTHPLKIELAMYAREDLRAQTHGAESRWSHFRKAIKMYLPDNIFAWHRWVDDFGEEWCETSVVNVWGAGGTTKSGIVGAFCLFDVIADPRNTLVVMVTNPLEKHWDRCFSKALLWRNALPKELQVGRIQQQPKPALLTTEVKEGSRRGILCISIDKGDTGQDIGKKVGAHAPRTRLILEEGQTLPKDTLNIATNLFMGSHDKKEVNIGNPMSWKGNALGEASIPASGDTKEIDDKKPDRWLTQRSHDDKPGVTLVFDGMKCPTHDSPAEAKRLSFMIQPRDIESALKIPGAENTQNFWSQIRGRIPPAGQVLTLFNDLDWDAIGVHTTHPWTAGYDSHVGIDVSLGGDAIPMYLFGVGMTANHGIVAQKITREHVLVDISKPNRNRQIGTQVAANLKRWGITNLNQVSVECSGQQGAIADMIEECSHALGIQGLVYRVRSEEAVTDRQVSTGKVMQSLGPGEAVREKACYRYKDRATELLLNVVELIQNNLIWGLDDDVKHQLCTRGYDEASLDGGKTKAEKKKPWIEKNQGKSPDELDAVAVAVAKFLEKRILVPGKDTRMKHDAKPNIPAWMLKKTQPSYCPPSSKVSRMLGMR